MPKANPQGSHIIVFGSAGTGKSSFINMLAGDSETSPAPISKSFKRCTFSAQSYPVDLNGMKCGLWDTQGLDDASGVSAEALRSLGELVRQLASAGGVSLLVYCIAAGRTTTPLDLNYDLFHGIICQAAVPTLVVATRCENELVMESWWENNRKILDGYGLYIKPHVCITATKGRLKNGTHVFQEEYDYSRKAVAEAIAKNVLKASWRPSSEAAWIQDVENRVRRYLAASGRGRKRIIYKSRHGGENRQRLCCVQ